MSQKFDTRQSKQRDYLSQVAKRSDFNTDSGNTVEKILQGVNTELTPAFRLYPNDPANLILNVGANFVSNSETSVRHSNQPIQKLFPVFTGGSVTLPAASGGSIVATPTAAVAPTLTISPSSFIKALIEVDSLGNLTVSLGNEGASEALATFPGINQKAFQIGLLIIRTNGAGNVQAVSSTDIVQLIGGGSGGAGGGSGDRTPITGYQWLETDNFEDSVSSSAAKVETTGYTNATQDLANDLFRLLCDKTKTVTTSSGTALTINSAPSFTVAYGDVVYLSSGARIGQWRRIATVVSQTSFILDAAFTGGDASAADTLMVSQAVWTKDLVNFGDAAQKDRARDFFSGDISTIAIDYFDSITVADTVPNYVDQACVVASASNSGLVSDVGVPLSSTFAGTYERPQAPNQIDNYDLSANATRERLFVAFFCNPLNASVTTAANVLGYEASFYAEPESINSGSLESAICFSDNSTTPINCSVTSASGQTIVTLSWSYVPNVKSGEPESAIEVYVDGKSISRYVSAAETPPTDIYWTEASDDSGIRNKIVFNADLSASAYEIKVVKRQGVYDASPVNSAKLGAIYDIVVGSADQVTAGVANYTSIQTAHDAAATDAKILILPGTYTGNITMSKRLLIEGRGYGSQVNGTFTMSAGSNFSTVRNARFLNNVSISSDGSFFVQNFIAPTFSVTDTGTANLVQAIME